ncbi:hypothetical protein ACFOSC_21285 [Streptantibioticus rubrisoli]|uniref:Uncharacterized protein n=1 Tax=Streptantibioticus rubrisoli TaxID=1387313 RepID=A0ABT1P547_9ACTN|nr:hypothetical protein [Streptantibioticus rubrisoli]MCQ4040496.1 hypothetical protein [Streptantibioticus rubrisoli]
MDFQTYASLGSTAGTKARMAALADALLDWRFTALPPAARGLTVREYRATGAAWSLIPVPDDADSPEPRVADLVRTSF